MGLPMQTRRLKSVDLTSGMDDLEEPRCGGETGAIARGCGCLAWARGVLFRWNDRSAASAASLLLLCRPPGCDESRRARCHPTLSVSTGGSSETVAAGLALIAGIYAIIKGIDALT